MAYIRTCVQNLGEIRRPVRKTWLSSLIIDKLVVWTCLGAFVRLLGLHVQGVYRADLLMYELDWYIKKNSSKVGSSN